MNQVKLTVRAGDAAARGLEAELLALDWPQPDAVSRFEARGGWQVDAYFTGDDIAASLAPLLDRLDLRDAAVITDLAEENWVAVVEAALSPVEVGRYTIHGPHDRTRVGSRPFAIEIEAAGAFGTAHHGSTQGCLAALDRILPDLAPRRVLDLGTGSGILAIAVAKLIETATVVGSDIDPPSIDIAIANAASNGVASSTSFVVAEGLDHPLLSGKAAFDLVIANILAEPLIELAPGLVRAMAPSGRIVLSGLLVEQAAAVLAAYRAAGVVQVERIEIGDWATLVLAPSA